MNIESRLQKLEAQIKHVQEPMAIFIRPIPADHGKPVEIEILGWRVNREDNIPDILRLEGETDEELQQRARRVAFASLPGRQAVLMVGITTTNLERSGRD